MKAYRKKCVGTPQFAVVAACLASGCRRAAIAVISLYTNNILTHKCNKINICIPKMNKLELPTYTDTNFKTRNHKIANAERAYRNDHNSVLRQCIVGSVFCRSLREEVVSVRCQSSDGSLASECCGRWRRQEAGLAPRSAGLRHRSDDVHTSVSRRNIRRLTSFRALPLSWTSLLFGFLVYVTRFRFRETRTVALGPAIYRIGHCRNIGRKSRLGFRQQGRLAKRQTCEENVGFAFVRVLFLPREINMHVSIRARCDSSFFHCDFYLFIQHVAVDAGEDEILESTN